MKGITLIGMPGSGKSTIGKLLAEKLEFQFLDLDVYIQEKQGKHQDVIAKEHGEAELMRLEEVYTLKLSFENVIFSPGGSIVYSALAMEKLGRETTLIYLDRPMEELKRNLGNTTYSRGIIGIREKGVYGLFHERAPLYRSFARHTIACAGLSQEDIIQRISGFFPYNALRQHG